MTASAIKFPPGDRVRKDDDGQWWYYWPPKPGETYAHRAAVPERTCHSCGSQFVTYPGHRTQPHCSRLCSRRCDLPDCAPINFSRKRASAERSPHWKGGRRKNQHGYVLIYAPEHPDCQGTTRRYVLEHRLVMENVLGRFLQPHEKVHHRNGRKADNRPENLELWVKINQPIGTIRATEEPHCATCTCQLM